MFGPSPLSRDEREAIAVAVSATNGCEYCVSHHSAALLAYWRDEERVRRFAADPQGPGLPARLEAMVHYAVKLTRSPAGTEASDITALRDHDLSDEEILQVNLIIAYFNFVNRIAEGLGVTPKAEEVAGYRY